MIMDIKKFAQSGKMKVVVITVICLAILSAIFQAGVFVGFNKASFLFKGGDNFYRAFGDRDDVIINSMGMGGGMFRDEFSGGHGAIGKIVKVNLPTIVVIGPDNIEKTILLSDDTTVHQLRNVSSTDKLEVDQYITVLGAPNDDGQIVAKFIRVIPPPMMQGLAVPFNQSSSTTNIK